MTTNSTRSMRPLGRSNGADTTGNLVTSSPAVANGVVYVGSYDHKLYALDAATGAFKWSDTMGGGVWSSPAVANGIVYIGNDDHKLYALDAATGAFLWSYTTGDQVTSSPAVANGVVYVGSLDNSLYALDAVTGAFLWSYTTGNRVWSSPAVANGVIYVGSWDGKVYMLDAVTGAFLWSYTTGNGVESSPAVANGVVYVGSWDGKVYALGSPQDQLPVAKIIASTVEPIVGELVTFDGGGSYDPDGFIVSYVWDFGDGSTGSGISCSHVYNTAGKYTVTLTVTDDDGLTDSETIEVKITEYPELTVTIVALGNLTYEISKTIHFSGTNTASNITYLFITGPDLPVNGVKLADPFINSTSGNVTTFTSCPG